MNTIENFEIIKTRNLYLENDKPSDEIVLADQDGDGDMYFTFSLKYVDRNEQLKTHFSTKDDHHADFVIETKPNTVTMLNQPISIGNYGKDKKELFVNFVVKPCDASKLHNVTITFSIKK